MSRIREDEEAGLCQQCEVGGTSTFTSDVIVAER